MGPAQKRMLRERKAEMDISVPIWWLRNPNESRHWEQFCVLITDPTEKRKNQLPM